MSLLDFKKGNIFDSKCEAIVCPVNCGGVLGAGLAKAFRDKENFSFANMQYIQTCQTGMMAPGAVLVVEDKTRLSGFTHIIYLATKFHYSDESKLEWVENGLMNLSKALYYYGIQSVAIPALGAGLGKLPYVCVELAIKRCFEHDEEKHRIVEAYLPL